MGEYLINVSQVEWPLLHVILGKRSTWNADDDNWRHDRHRRGILNKPTSSGELELIEMSRRCARREMKETESGQQVIQGNN